MNSVKAVKIVGTVCQIIGVVGGVAMAGFELHDGIKQLKDLNSHDVNDSVAPVTEVEA